MGFPTRVKQRMTKKSGIWQQDEIKNLIDLYKTYKVPINELNVILNRTNRDIMKKLIELKEINDPNSVLITIMNLHKEISQTDNIHPIELLCEVISDLTRRIEKLESK